MWTVKQAGMEHNIQLMHHVVYCLRHAALLYMNLNWPELTPSAVTGPWDGVPRTYFPLESWRNLIFNTEGADMVWSTDVKKQQVTRRAQMMLKFAYILWPSHSTRFKEVERPGPKEMYVTTDKGIPVTLCLCVCVWAHAHSCLRTP